MTDKLSQRQSVFSSTLIVLVFLYLGAVYFSFALSNILLGVLIVLFVLCALTRKISFNFSKKNKILYTLVIIPFVLTLVSSAQSYNFYKGIDFLWLRAPILIVPAIIIFTNFCLKTLKKGFSVYVFLSAIAAIETVYNAVRYINEDILLVPDFTFLITTIQHPYFGVYLLIASAAIIELKLIKHTALKWVIVSLFLICIVLTTSRLVYFLTTLMYSYYLFKKLSWKKATLVVIIIISSLSTILIQNKGILNKFKTSFSYENSPRLKLWHNAYKVTSNAESLFFGLGIGDFYAEKKEEYFFKESNYGTMGYNPHSQIVEFFVTNGVFGLIIIGVLILFGFVSLKKQSPFSYIVFLIIVSFSFTECILTRQYGVQLYCIFMPLIFKKILVKNNELFK